MIKNYFAGCLLTITCWFLSCLQEKPSAVSLREGTWRGILTVVDSIGLIIPFNFEVQEKNDSVFFEIRNAEERITVNEISFRNDSVFFRMPLFDSEFLCKLQGDSLMEGIWLNHARKEKNIVPFSAVAGDTSRFDCPVFERNYPFEGKWKCLFSPNYPDSSYAIGIFRQEGSKATGTFLTETGDYRYLEGCVFGNYMLLSCFDGSHAFVFHAEIMEDSTIWGEFYSGIHHHETWIAWKDSAFRLRNPDSLTFLKKGFSKINFSYPDTEGKKVSLADEKFKSKAVVLQIMGSWCPNCTDETELLSGFYRKYKNLGLEIVALCFEKTEESDKAKKNVLRVKNKFAAEYDFLITGFQPKDADKALPMLNHVMSFPTTVFIDRDGVVRKIYTGYPGPAAGMEHEKFLRETEQFIAALLKAS